jgi:hypothetical protein
VYFFLFLETFIRVYWRSRTQALRHADSSLSRNLPPHPSIKQAGGLLFQAWRHSRLAQKKKKATAVRSRDCAFLSPSRVFQRYPFFNVSLSCSASRPPFYVVSYSLTFSLFAAASRQQSAPPPSPLSVVLLVNAEAFRGRTRKTVNEARRAANTHSFTTFFFL